MLIQKKQTVKNTDKVQHLIIDAPTKVILKTGSEFQVQSKFPNLKKRPLLIKMASLKFLILIKNIFGEFKLILNSPSLLSL